METDKHYFFEGLFIIGMAIAAALFSIWLVSTGHRDDVLYRIHFEESVSGLSVGDPVKFHGVNVGTVKTIGSIRRIRAWCRWTSACAKIRPSRPIPRRRCR